MSLLDIIDYVREPAGPAISVAVAKGVLGVSRNWSAIVLQLCEGYQTA